MKTCTLCKVEKLRFLFSKHKLSKDGFAHWCKECNRKRGKLYRRTPAGIYSTLRGCTRFRNKKPFNISRDDFIRWYESQPKICGYCDLPEEDLWALQNHYGSRVKRLTVDSMDNFRGYDEDNIILACARCNFIKSDLLSYEEMREFSQKYIKPNWMRVMNEKGEE